VTYARQTPDSAAIFSGGLDSTTLVYDAIEQGYMPHLISFDYGQRHKKELQYAAATAVELGLRHDIVDLSSITHLISNSALTSYAGVTPDTKASDLIDVPEGHYAEDNMKATVVPNRNMIMISIAAGIAVNNGYRALFTGVHAGDHFVYPDCRPEFIQITNAAIMSGNKGFGPFDDAGNVKDGDEWSPYLMAPYMHKTKADIAHRAITMGVPIEKTWSCYKGGDIHCGKCGTCVERLEAIDEAAARTSGGHGSDYDATQYEDSEFWRTAIANAK
jgi:7-cyano-7-deazaguanine synthase